MNYLLVAVGGAVGSLARYKVGSLVLHSFPNAKFPLGTFLINLLGCFVIGSVITLIEKVSYYNAEIRLLVITGFLGGFTTFSAFGAETLSLLREGEIFIAFLYASLSVILGIAVALLGL